MFQIMNKSAIVIGAGIVGLATARALAEKGFKVTVIERESFSMGASIRNFGMIWPIGQPEGVLLNRALRSREIWMDMLSQAAVWHNPCGSIHVAYNDIEWNVLQELAVTFENQGRSVLLLSKEQVLQQYPAVNAIHLKGGLFSSSELIINPLLSIASLPNLFKEKYQIEFLWGQAVNEISGNSVLVNSTKLFADQIFVCTGADFAHLYPEIYKEQLITKCSLQMMRMISKSNQSINTSICGGLSLIHYKSFEAAPSIAELKKHYEQELPEYLQLGIHVMIDQNNLNEFIIGDSHEYGNSFLPFNKVYVNQLILEYLKSFININDLELVETWQGIYPKMLNGATELTLSPTDNVHIINGLGGAGMTLSFGLAEEYVNAIF